VTGSEQVERELKFIAAPGLDLASVVAGVHHELIADEPETHRLHASYFDTSDLRLARAGASLRHRDDDGWTVKLPRPSGVALERSELHVDGPPGDPPAAAVDLVHALIRRAPLRLAAHLDTNRTRVVLRDADGDVLAELVDDDVSVHDGAASNGTAFRELEVEFTAGTSADVVDRIAEDLRRAGAGEPEHLSKIARALGPRALDAPDLVPPSDLDFASTPTEVLRAAISRSTGRLLAHDPGVRLGDDPEDVHQARVATRRIRSDLRTFREVVDPGWDESLRTELKWLGDLLGAVRDTDVLLGRLESRVESLDAADQQSGAHLLDGLRAQRDEAREELLAGLRSDRYLDLLERLLAASRAVPSSVADLELDLGDVVATPWKKLRKAVKQLDEHPPDAELHRVRIKAKRARYAAEAVTPALGKGAKRFASAVADLQDVLGEHQDAVVAGQWLRDHRSDDPSTAFVAGRLAGIEDAAAQASRDAWESVWKRARRSKLRKWM
jgi:CHAD domain-containing protein